MTSYSLIAKRVFRTGVQSLLQDDTTGDYYMAISNRSYNAMYAVPKERAPLWIIALKAKWNYCQCGHALAKHNRGSCTVASPTGVCGCIEAVPKKSRGGANVTIIGGGDLIQRYEEERKVYD